MVANQPQHFDGGATLPVDSLFFEIGADEYAAQAAPFFATSPILSDDNLDLNTIEIWQTERCVLIEAASNPFVLSRTQNEMQNAGHLIEVTRFLEGSEQGTMGDSIIDRVPGPIYILDLAQRNRTVLSKFKVEQIYVPKAALGVTLENPKVEIVVDAKTPSGLLLHACMDSLFESLKRNSSALSMALLDRYISLLKVNLGVPPQREDVRGQLRQSLFSQICAYVEENLANPTLSASAILRSFGVSRASLYRMFDPYGGVRTYIMQRRVARAVLDLEQNSLLSGRMRHASERWGFSSQPNFNRKIRSRFGTNPGNLFHDSNEARGSRDEEDRMLAIFAERSAIAA